MTAFQIFTTLLCTFQRLFTWFLLNFDQGRKHRRYANIIVQYIHAYCKIHSKCIQKGTVFRRYKSCPLVGHEFPLNCYKYTEYNYILS